MNFDRNIHGDLPESQDAGDNMPAHGAGSAPVTPQHEGQAATPDDTGKDGGQKEELPNSELYDKFAQGKHAPKTGHGWGWSITNKSSNSTRGWGG